MKAMLCACLLLVAVASVQAAGPEGPCNLTYAGAVLDARQRDFFSNTLYKMYIVDLPLRDTVRSRTIAKSGYICLWVGEKEKEKETA